MPDLSFTFPPSIYHFEFCYYSLSLDSNWIVRGCIKKSLKRLDVRFSTGEKKFHNSTKGKDTVTSSLMSNATELQIGFKISHHWAHLFQQHTTSMLTSGRWVRVKDKESERL